MTEKYSLKEIEEAKVPKKSAARCTPAACDLYDLPTGSCTFPEEPKLVKLGADCDFRLTTKHTSDIVGLRRGPIKKPVSQDVEEIPPRPFGYVLPK